MWDMRETLRQDLRQGNIELPSLNQACFLLSLRAYMSLLKPRYQVRKSYEELDVIEQPIG